MNHLIQWSTGEIVNEKEAEHVFDQKEKIFKKVLTFLPAII